MPPERVGCEGAGLLGDDVAAVDGDRPDDEDVEDDDGDAPQRVVRHRDEAADHADAGRDDGDGPGPHDSPEQGRPGERDDDAEDQVQPAPRGDVELEDVLGTDDVEGVVEQGDEALEGVEHADHHHQGSGEHRHADGSTAVPVVGVLDVAGYGCAWVRHGGSDSLVGRPDGRAGGVSFPYLRCSAAPDSRTSPDRGEIRGGAHPRSRCRAEEPRLVRQSASRRGPPGPASPLRDDAWRLGESDGGRKPQCAPGTPRSGSMSVTALVVITAVLFGWGLVSARFERANVTAPIVFITAGAVLAWTGVLHAPEASEQLTPLVESTLVWVLFSDAARLPLAELRRDVGRYARLLAIGLPLTIVLGWALAAWFFPSLGVWLALLVGAALAPTDAALGMPIVTNLAVPRRLRELITVESGLNDGIATPIVMFAIAGSAAALGLESAESARSALVQLLLGAAVGSGIGALGGWMMRQARRHRLAAEEFTGIAVLALALLSYAAAVALDGNGFVAAFCGGLAFGACAGRRAPEELAFLEQTGGGGSPPPWVGVGGGGGPPAPSRRDACAGRRAPEELAFLEQTGGLLSLLVWMVFGVVAIPIALKAMDAVTVLYAVLSLTLVRMLPVALALVGARLDGRAILFAGWFGPRGLASLVFALLALESLGREADEAGAIIAVSVLLSVFAHGLSAAPLAQWYGRAARGAPEGRSRRKRPTARS